MKRHTNDNSLSVAKNTGQILSAVNDHVMWLPEKEPNQTDAKYYTYDISCNEDFALHMKHHNWRMVFDFFRDHPRVKASFATKVVPVEMLKYNPKGKVRIRFSLMPQSISDELEPKTAKIIDRVKAIDAFVEAGYEVHVNFSPIVVRDGWLEEYSELFDMLNEYVENKESVLAECIFLTHNKDKHEANLRQGVSGESLLWTPKNQEVKTSQYGGKNLRYRRDLKAKYINEFKELHDSKISWNTIRYIF
jgi:spore photoproduct lyase